MVNVRFTSKIKYFKTNNLKRNENKFRQNIVIGVIAIVGTMGYNLSINQENENVRLITGNIEALAEEEGGLDCNYNRHPSQCEIYVGAKVKSNYWVVL